MLGYCGTYETGCQDMVHDATRVGTPRTCSPAQIRTWMEDASRYGYPYKNKVSITTIETGCGPIYG